MSCCIVAEVKQINAFDQVFNVKAIKENKNKTENQKSPLFCKKTQPNTLRV